jgi:heterodisulfide reductase subunit C
MEKKEDAIIVSELDFSFCEEVASQPGGEHIKKCFACGTCVAGCPVSEIDEEYSPRKIIRQILFGMREEVLTSPLIWYCLVCYRCYARCPQKVNFTDIMRVLRYLAIKAHYAPPDILTRTDEIDRLSQIIRHDLVHYDLEQKKEFLEELQLWTDQRLRGEASG